MRRERETEREVKETYADGLSIGRSGSLGEPSCTQKKQIHML